MKRAVTVVRVPRLSAFAVAGAVIAVAALLTWALIANGRLDPDRALLLAALLAAAIGVAAGLAVGLTVDARRRRAAVTAVAEETEFVHEADAAPEAEPARSPERAPDDSGRPDPAAGPGGDAAGDGADAESPERGDRTERNQP